MPGKISAGQIDHAVHGLRDSQTKKPFTEPKLTFIEPKLTKHGDATEITGSFFQVFYTKIKKNVQETGEKMGR